MKVGQTSFSPRLQYYPSDYDRPQKAMALHHTTEMKKKKPIRVKEGSGNVFADLGFPNPEREQLKARLTLQIYRLIKERGLTQAKAGAILGIRQPHVSGLMRGQSGNFSVERLMNLLTARQDVGLIRGAIRQGRRVPLAALLAPYCPPEPAVALERGSESGIDISRSRLIAPSTSAIFHSMYRLST